MKKTSIFLKSTVVALLLLPAFLGAEEERAEMQPKEKTEVAEELTLEEAGELPDATRSGFFFNQQPVRYPVSSHRAVKVFPHENSLELEDGSRWAVHPSDTPQTLYWGETMQLTITQNGSSFYRYLFTNHDFLIVDLSTGEYVRANLELGPILSRPSTNLISIMDRSQRALALTNNMELDVYSGDEQIFRNWLEGQAIIIGINSDWSTRSEYNFILINVYNQDFVRAKQRKY